MQLIIIAVLLGIEATVSPSTVDAQNTDLHLDGGIVNTLHTNDYFLISLPSQVSVSYLNNISTPLSCQFRYPVIPITSCVSLSSQIIQLTLGAALSYSFQFDVLGAITNPPSTTFTDTLIVQTFQVNASTPLDYQQSGILIAATNDSLISLQMVSSASQFAGDQNTLQFGIQTKNPVTPNGLVQVQFPYLFKTSFTQMSMVNPSLLSCTDMSQNIPIPCVFDTKTQTVNLTSLVGAQGNNSDTIFSFSISGVINPISTDVSASITVRTTDSYGGVIDQSVTQLQVTQPSQIANATIQADSSVAQEFTTYTIQFSVTVPMYAPTCTVVIYLPFPDFNIAATPITGVQNSGLSQHLYEVNLNDNSITITDICNNTNNPLGQVLPGNPQIISILGLSNPEVAKLTSSISISIWNGNNGYVAQLTTGNSPSFQITTGNATNVSLVAPTQQINSVTAFTVYFQFQHQVTTDLLSTTNNPAQIEVTLTDLNFPISPTVSIASTNISGASVTVDSFSSLLNKVTVKVTTPQIQSDTLYFIQFTNITLAGAVHTMGPIIVQLSMQWFTGSSFVYYPIDNGTFTGLLSTTQGQFLSATIVPASSVTYALTTYSFQLQIENSIPQGGYIVINIPPEIQMASVGFQCMYAGLSTLCSYNTQRAAVTVTGLFLNGAVIPVSTPIIVISVEGIINPRSLKTTSIFSFSSFDQQNELIDFYSQQNTAITMSQPASFTQAEISSISSLRVGDTNVTYQLTLELMTLLIAGDFVLITLPLSGEIPPPALAQCTSAIDPNLQCSLTSNNQLMLTLSTTVAPSTLIMLNLQGFSNPLSGVSTSPFKIGIYDANGYAVAMSDPTSNLLSVQMTLPYVITSGATISTDTNVPTSNVVITIQFPVSHQIIQGSSLVITFPSQLTPNISTLQVTSPQSASTNKVVLNYNQIVCNNFFTSVISAGSNLQLQIVGFKNPNISTPTDAFVINFFTPGGFVIDSLQQTGLSIQSKCNYPCKDCGQNPSVCSACMTSDMSTFNLLQAGTCVSQCIDGYYEIGNLCNKCDSTCQTCQSSSLQCTSCPGTFDNFYLLNNRCVSQCGQGYFQNFINSTCDQCEAPCLNCDTSVTSCVECVSGTYFYESACDQTCPPNHFIANPTNWTCDSCTNNCSTCQMTTGQCTSCLPDFKLVAINSTCISGECPVGVTVEETPDLCSSCSQECKTCGNKNTTYCLTCSIGLYLNPDNNCIASCGPSQATAIGIDGMNHCVDCSQGCAKCTDGKPDVCTVCENGLVNFNFTVCLTQCPDGFVVNNKSGNCLNSSITCPYGYSLNSTDQCQLAVSQCLPGYVLNGYLDQCIPVPGHWIPFPVLFTIILSSFILLIRIRASKSRQTRVIPSLIVLWSLFELPLFLLQAIFAAWIWHWVALIFTILAICLHFPVNYYSVRIFLPRSLFTEGSQETSGHDDNAFRHWAGDHLGFLLKLRRAALYYNHKVIRMIESNYLGQTKYLATYDRADLGLHKPLLKVAVANMILTYLLIIIADVFVLKALVIWGYQFTVFCVESLILVIAISILEIVDYCQTRQIDKGYFKVAARHVDGNNVFSGVPDQERDNSDRQQSKERHVYLLQKINDELEHMRNYSGNFYKIGDYHPQHPHMLEGSGIKWWRNSPRSPQQSRNVEQNYLTKYLSTQNHYKWNKKGFNEYPDSGHLPSEVDKEDTFIIDDGGFDLQRGCHSLISESEYPNEQALVNFREELTRLLEEDLPHTKTLDYKSSFHILDNGVVRDSDSDTGGEDNQKRSMYMLQRPPKHNISDVMGHFEQDQRGNSMIVKRSTDGGFKSELVDAIGRRVNRRGYLVDDGGNVVNKYGVRVVDQPSLDPTTDDIPPELFRELFIPQQVSRNQKHHKGRMHTGKHRASNALVQKGSTSSNNGKSRDTFVPAEGLQRNILSDGEDAYVEDDDEYVHTYQDSVRKSNQNPMFQTLNQDDSHHIMRKSIDKSWSRKKRKHSRVSRVSTDGNQSGSEQFQINIQMQSIFENPKKKISKEQKSHSKTQQTKKPQVSGQISILKKEGSKAIVSGKVVTKPKLRKVVVKSPETAIQSGDYEIGPEEKVKPALNEMDALINEVTQPKIPKARAISAKPVYARRVERVPFDPSLYRVHVDVDVSTDQARSTQRKPVQFEPNSSIANLIDVSEDNIEAAMNFKKRLPMDHFDSSLMQSLDRPIQGIAGKPLSSSGLQIMKNQERYGQAEDMNDKFYHHLLSTQNPSIISPSASLQSHAFVVNQGKRLKNDSIQSNFYTRSVVTPTDFARPKNAVSSAYSQNLTLLMKNAAKKPTPKREDDPFAILKKIFQAKPPRQ